MDTPLLELRNLTVRYASGGKQVLAVDNLDLTIGDKSFVTLIGPSGCGKSSVLNVMAGYLAPSSGQALMQCAPITGPGPDRAVVHQQTTALLPWLNVEDNVGLGLLSQKLTKAQRREAAKHYLELVRLSGFEKTAIYHLSGGMRQRVALARALATESKVVLLDEPLGAIDALQRGMMQDFLLQLWAESGRSFFLITHSVEEAIYLGTSVLTMSSRPGRIIARHDVGFGRDALRQGGAKIRAGTAFVKVQAELLELLVSEGTQPQSPN